MRPRSSLALSLAAAALAALAALALALRPSTSDPDTARAWRAAAAGPGARLVVVGNSVADTTLDAPTLGRAALGDPDAAVVLTAPGGGALHLYALLAGPAADLRPAVVLAWLLPATWRDARAPTGSDRARLLSLTPPGDRVVAAQLFGGDPLRALGATLDVRRTLARDRLVQGYTRAAASLVRSPSQGRRDDVFAEVVGTWAAAPAPPNAAASDPDWPRRALPPLVAGARSLGAELWLCEPVDPTDHPDSRFTRAERQAIAALGVAVVPTPRVDLPAGAMGAGAHVMPAYKIRASEGVGAWLRANPPSGALAATR